MRAFLAEAMKVNNKVVNIVGFVLLYAQQGGAQGRHRGVDGWWSIVNSRPRSGAGSLRMRR